MNFRLKILSTLRGANNMSKKGKEGDIVKFIRNGMMIMGKVLKVREASVIVSISNDDAEALNLDTPFTIVSNKNYVIVL